MKGGTAEPFRFEFGAAGEYGAPRDIDGMVHQVQATWVNGLTTGTYFVRAWVLGYFQTNADGSALQEPQFSVTPTSGDITISVVLRA